MATAGASECAMANMYRCFYCSNLANPREANRHGDGTDHLLAQLVEGTNKEVCIGLSEHHARPGSGDAIATEKFRQPMGILYAYVPEVGTLLAVR